MDSQTSGALPIEKIRVSSVPERGFSRPSTAHELFDLASAAVNILYAASNHIYAIDSDAFTTLCRLHSHVAQAHDWVFAAKWISDQRRAA